MTAPAETETSEHSPARRKSSIPPEEIAKLRNLYAGHKVVAFPEGGEQRGRMTSRASSSSKPRPRSLSAGRSRIRPNDLVQDVYDRLGVSRSTCTSATDVNWGLSADNNTSLDNTADFDFAAASTFNPFTSPLRSNTTATREERNVAEGGSKKAKERSDSTKKFNERFVSAASRGRQAERSPGDSSPQERRSRSLSRGRMAQRWPPSRQEPVLPTVESTSAPVASVDMARSPTRSLNDTRSAPVVATAPAPTTPDPAPNTRSSLIRSEPKRTNTYVSTVPSFMNDLSYDSTNNQKNSKPTEGWKDEKKEAEVDGNKQDTTLDDQPPALHINPPSIKDRISAYGGKSGAKKKASHKNFSRSIDKQYAAHFAVREHPPKVDIYEGCGNSVGTDTDEKKEEDKATNVDVVIQTCKSASSDASIKSTESAGNTNIAASQTTLSSHKPRGTVALSKKTSVQRNAPNGIHRPNKSVGRMAASFLAAIQQPQLSPKNKAATSATTNKAAPVTEVAADEHFINGTDAQSLAMSSVSADDYALRSPVADPNARKSLWNDRQNRSTRTHPVISTTSPVYQQSPIPEQKVGGAAAVNTGSSDINHMKPDEIQRIIDERVQAQVSDIETKLGAQLRRWMQQMDDKMSIRVDAMANKIQRLESMLEEIQSTREV